MNHVDEIKRRITIEDVVGSYIDLKPAGKNFKALCPFHQEKTPSFVVTPERDSFYCFGCNRGGDIFTFVEEFEGVDFRGALKILAERTGVELREYSKKERGEQDEKERLLTLLDQAASAYEAELEKATEARAYIEKRGISKEAQKAFRLGFAPDSWDFVATRFPKVATSELEKTGLIKESEKRPGRHYDRFRNRVMFPIMDSSGRVIGFSGRALAEDDKTAKYINSPETEVFKKRNVLYGIDKAKRSIRKRTFAILVEGQVDLVLSHEKGFTNTVAASGTALREAAESEDDGSAAFTLLKRLTKNLVLAFDSDRAGKEAAIKNGRYALSLGMDVKLARLPSDADPADILIDSPDQWRSIIRDSVNIVEFELKEIVDSTKSSQAALKAIESQTFETIASIQSRAEQDIYLKYVSEHMGISKTALVSDYEAFLKRQQRPAQTQNTKQTKTKEQGHRQHGEQDKNRLAGLVELLSSKEEAENKEAQKKLCDEVEALLGESAHEHLHTLSPPEREKILVHLERELPKERDKISAIKETLTRTKIYQLTSEAQTIRKRITEWERSGEAEKAEQEIERFFSIQREIDSLKHNHAT